MDTPINFEEKSQKQLQTGEKIRKLASEFFMKEALILPNGKELKLMASKADISKDMSNCTLYVSSIEDFLAGFDEQNQKALLGAIAMNVKQYIAKKANLRKVPRIEIEISC